MDSKLLVPLINAMVDEAFSKIELVEGPQGIRGPRGIPGKDGQDFILEDHREEILKFIVDNYRPFTNITDEDIALFKGQDGKDGRDGKDGKDFELEPHKQEILDYVEENFKPEIELTEDQIFELKGRDGKDGRNGQDGEGFDFDDHKKEISQIINNYIENLVPVLKLKFDDLTQEDKYQLKLKFTDLSSDEIFALRGPRGQRGKQGQQGLAGIDGIDGKDGINGIDGAMGPRGQIGPQGIKGDKGESGEDGLDAPIVTDIQVDQTGRDVSLIFGFDNGEEITTPSFELPKNENIYNVYHSQSSIVKSEYQDEGVTQGFGKKLNVVGDGATLSMIDDVAVLNIPGSTYPELPDGYEQVNYFNQQLAVPNGVDTLLFTKIVSNTAFLLKSIEVGGSNKATYQVFINGSLVGLKRTYYTYLNERFDFSLLELVTGDELEVFVTHPRPSQGDFEIQVNGIEKL